VKINSRVYKGFYGFKKSSYFFCFYALILEIFQLRLFGCVLTLRAVFTIAQSGTVRFCLAFFASRNFKFKFLILPIFSLKFMGFCVVRYEFCVYILRTTHHA